MSRGLSAENLAQIAAQHHDVVLMAHLAFDTPIFVHTGIGTITFDGNDYLGVGGFGGAEAVEESELLAPSPIRLVLSGVDSTYITEAMTAGNHGDAIKLYVGYVNKDMSLVADPWALAGGFFDYATVEVGEAENRIVVTMQHELAILNEADGGRFTDEDQQRRFAGDTGFSFVSDAIETNLIWGGVQVNRFGREGSLTPRGGGRDGK